MATSWKEVKTADGRVYYHDQATNKTSWAKPSELFDEKDRAIADLGWTKHNTKDFKTYWYHLGSNQTTWDPPADVKRILDAPPAQAAHAPSQPTYVTSNFSYAYNARRPNEQDARPNDRGGNRGGHPSRFQPEGTRPQGIASTEPEFTNPVEAEMAFMKVLKKAGVDKTWIWNDTTLAKLQKEPQYRAVKDPMTRRALFDKLILEQRRQEHEDQLKRLQGYREDFIKMLRSHEDIKPYTTWKKAIPLIEREKIYRSNSNEEEKENMFNDYIAEQRENHKNAENGDRESALQELTSLFRDLGYDTTTQWKVAYETVTAADAFTDNPKFKALREVDILSKFEDYVHGLQNGVRQHKKGEQLMLFRGERHSRAAFLSALRDLRAKGILHAASDWSEIASHLKDETQFGAMLDLEYPDRYQGRTDPVELFLLEAYADEVEMRDKRKRFVDILDRNNLEFDGKASKEVYRAAIDSDPNHGLSEEDIEKIFALCYKRLAMPSEDSRRRRDEHVRRGEGSRRSKDSSGASARRQFNRLLQKLDPPLRKRTTWDEIKPQLREYREYRDLLERERIAEFEDVMDHLHEAEEDHRRNSRRQRDRDERAVRDDRSEPDAYQADRARAVAQRERQYQTGRASNFDGGYDRRDARRSSRSSLDRPSFDRRSRRDATPERGPRRDMPRRDSHDLAREYGYSRADPREKLQDQLDYGDAEGAGSTAGSTPGNRRRKSTTSERDIEQDSRPSKRQRTSKKEPPAATLSPAVEEENLRSGSEEGEIEED